MAKYKIYHILLASSALSCATFGLTTPGYAGPQDGTITAGSASIDQIGLTTSIYQSSDRAIIDWRSFDVGATESVRFYQPGSGSITLNRINDSKASLIDGQIEANGKILLLNQNGIVFGSSSRVDVAGLVATTGTIDDNAFMSGANTLAIGAGNNAHAQIINNGTISARDAGLVGLVGPHVENNGTITAHLGKVTLAGAERVTLDLAGDELISIDVSDMIDGSVKNGGSITADGGTITLTASRARNAVESSIINTGTLRANSVGIHNGRIILSAGGNKAGDTGRGQSPKAAIVQAGKIEAKSGAVEILGDSIKLESQSIIDVSATEEPDSTAGTVNIGGSYQGTPDRVTATWVEADRGSLIPSNGNINDDGGTIILWADRLMTYRGRIEAEGGEFGGDGGFVEISGKNQLIYDGYVSTLAPHGRTGTLLLDPTNIEISSAADQDTTGSSPFEPIADDVTSILNATTLLNALASSSVIVQTRATGSQAGDITVNAALSWGSGNTLTLDAHHDIIINQAITGANLTLTAGNDISIGAALSGTGTLHILPKSAAGTMGVGTGATGTLQLSNADLANISDGWGNLRFGRTDGSGALTFAAHSWTDNVEIDSGSGVITISGSQTMGANNLTFVTDANPAINAALTGTGILTIQAASAGTGIGLGTGQTGTIGFTNAELANITDGWTNIVVGRTDGSGAINVGARTWNDALTLQSGNGVISINGVQTMGANNLTLTSDANPVIGAALTGTGALSFLTAASGTSIGLAGEAGTFNLSNAELANITDGWSSITIGSITNSGGMNVGAYTWTDVLTLQTGSGGLNINGAQTMGVNALTLSTDSNIAINAALTGTGTLTLQSATAGTTTSVAGAGGTFELSSADLANITDGWDSIVIGRADQSGGTTVNTATWADRLTLRSGSGVLTVAGNQTMGANNLILSTDGDIALNANLIGSGDLTIQGATTATTIGLAGQAGTLNLDATELGRITDGWANIIIGRTDGSGAMALGTRTWTDNLTLQSASGIITIAGVQTMGANNLLVRTDADLAVNASLTGTGNLTVQGNTASTTMGIGTGQAGTLALTNAEVANLTNTWANIFMGRTDGSGAITVGALTWSDPLTFQSSSGVITIAGAQTLGVNALTFITDADIALNAALGGSTTLTIQGASTGTTMGLGNSAAGTVNLTATEVGNITNGWTNLFFGRTDATGAMTLTANTWNDTLNLRSGSGTINITGTQGLTANNMNIVTDGDINLTGALTSTGTLTVAGSTASTTIGLGNAATGTINLTATEIGRITNGWNSLFFGSTTGTGAINVTANTWNDNLTLRSLTGVISISGAQAMGANNLTISTDADLSVTAGLTSTGTLTISGQTASTTMGIGTGQTGSIQLSDTEAANLDNTWGNIILGRTDGTGDINIGALTWVDPVTYRSLTGGINITGTQTMTTNSLTITTDGNLNIGGTLSSTGTGTLTVAGQSAATSIGLGTGQTGTLQLSDAEVTNLTNGWAGVVIGLTTGTGAINVGTSTWLDPLTLRTAAGVITFNGDQTMGANNLTITTDGNIGVGGLLSGTGTLTITQQTAATTMGIGTGQTGTIQFTDAEVTNLTNSWTSIILGLATGTGAINVGALTWLDPLTLRSGTGLMTIAGTQTMGANNLTLSTDSNLTLSGGANLTGSGTLTITSSAVATTMSLGTGQTGTLNVNDTEVSQITDGWTSIVFGNAGGTGAMNIGALTFNDALTLRTTTGAMNLNGALTMAAGNNLALSTTSGVIGVNSGVTLSGGGNLSVTTDGNMNIGASGTLTGTGNLVVQTATAATTIGLGNGAAGTLQLTDVELGRITDGWANLTFGQTGGTGVVTVGAMTWNDNVTIQASTGAINLTGATIYNGNVTLLTTTGLITVSGTMNVQGNNLTITTNGNPTFSAAIQGTGVLTIQAQAVATVVTVAGAATGLAIENTDLANILNGWSSIVIGRSDGTGTMNIGAYTWQYDTTFRTGSGVITISGAQTSTGNVLTYETDGNMAISANITGTGTLTIRGSANATTMGLAGGAGTLALTAAELTFIQDGWSQLVFGRASATGALTANARTWTDNVQMITGSGVMTVGAQTMNTATNLTLTTDSNLVLSAAQVGTGGKLTIEGASAATVIGVGAGQTGALALDANDITRMGSSWSSIQIGNSSATGAINIGTNSWSQAMTFITHGNITLNGVQTSTRTSGNSLVFASLSGNFVNATGSATPINPGTGTARYLIYSYSAATDTYGTMTPPGSTTLQTYFSYGPSSVVEAGNRIIYSQGAPKVVYIQIDSKTKVYGDSVPTFSWTYVGGLEGGDTIGMAILSSTLTAAGASLTDNAGTTRAITGMFTTDNGYNVSVTNGTLTVIKAPVSVRASNETREYGDANPTFTINYTGLRNGETSTVIDTLATAATTATATSNVNTYAITTSGAVDDNYVFNYTNGTLTITKATLTITADDKTREYGDANPALTVSYSGFKGTDTAAVIDTSPTISTTAIGTTNVGNVAITLSGGTDNNYNLTLVNGNLTITQATLTATADNQTREYGDANPALTTTYTGFKNGETAAVIDTAATAITSATNLSDVGTYAITTSGAVDTNYIFTYVDGTLSVTKATVTVTADNQTREYGDTNPALTVSYSGFKNGETFSVIDTGATAATTAIATTNAGNVAITASGAADNNYDFTYVAGTLAITKATLTATADNQTREYGDANPALTVSYTGFKNGETSAIIDTPGVAVTGATNTSNVGNYAITVSGATDNNYNFTYVAGNLAITQATLTATADNQTREYGDANPSLTTTYTGFKNGETAAVIDTVATATTSATTLSNVGGHTITTSGAVDTNYVFTYVAGTLTITKATLTATADNQSREYGDANPTLTVSYSGFKNGETASVIDTAATASTTAIATTNVGTVAITASGAADSNYDFSYVNGTLTITKAMLTATADNQTREYGDANPTLTVSYTGFKNGETSAVLNTAATASTAATATTNAGNVAITASGGVDDNYDFTYVAGTLAITKAVLTATADNQTREYGDANPTLTVSYTGFKNGETSAVIDTAASGATAATNFSNVGSYGITASGAADANYDFNYVGGTLSITKAMLTATADNQTREYGDANPTLTVSYSGFKNGETASVIDMTAGATTSATNLSNVGNYAITASGATDANYDFTYIAGNLAVTRAMLTATADNQTREYGDANPALTVSYTGFKNGETAAVIDTGATASTTAVATTNAGNIAITAGGAADTNYDFTYVAGTLSITKANLTITADNQTREYGDANPALTVSYSGFKNGETSAVIDTAPTISTVATSTSNVGSYAITLTGGTDVNYNLILQDGTLSVTKATLTATADNQTREYGDANPALTVTYTGFKNGETSAVIDTVATVATSANTFSNVGSYVISASGASDTNYDFVYANGSLAVTQATLTATADNQSREYGDVNPALTVSYTGFKNGETSAVIDSLATAVTGATNTSNAGTYAITASGASDSNYAFTYSAGTLTVSKAMLTATADNQTREYGDANPALTVSYTGFKLGETSAVLDTAATASTAATATTNAGNVAITVGGGVDNNYDFTYVAGTLAITKATLTATADNQTREYGDANPALTVSYAGFKNGETAAVIDTAATGATSATTLSNVGSYVISASGASDVNYDFVYANGSLTVTQATLTATADNQTREYGDANPALTVSYTGFKNGETSAVIDSLATAATGATNTSNAGAYAITVSGASDSNYAFAYTSGTLTVSKATLTATADNQTREYGDANPALTVSYTGFKNGETSAVIDTAATAATSAIATSNVGTYTITASGANDINYDFSYVNGTLSITPATITVTVNNDTREYGDANPVFSAIYAGLKNGETTAVFDTAVTIGTTAGLSSNVGTYAITASGGADTNYVFSYTGANLTITKAMLTVTADNQTREYGDANPSFSVSYTGFKNGETSTVLDSLATASSTATATTNVGTQAITVSGGTDNNYDYTYVNGTLTITKANLTVTADNQTREYGDANPALTFSYSGFKNGETSAVIDTAPTIATAAIATTNVGTHAITLTGGTDDNYNLILNNGTLTITKATLTATAGNATREYGDANPAFTVGYTGFKNGETDVVIDTGVTLSTIAGSSTNVGTYAITASGGLDTNYDFAYVSGTLSITPALVTVAVDNATREYGLANPGFSATYSGFKNGETATVLDNAPIFTTAATIGSNVGSYVVSASGATDTNYIFSYTNGNIVITQASLIVQVDNQSRLLGDPNPPLTYGLIGLRNGDTSAVLSGLTLTTPATPASPLGTYAITASGATAVNYSISYINNILVVYDGSGPVVEPVAPSSNLPMTVGYTLSYPEGGIIHYDPMYSTPSLRYVFLNNLAPAGQETERGTIRTSDGYITIFYFRNPFARTHGEPLIFIDPNLYLNFTLRDDDDDEDDLNISLN